MFDSLVKSAHHLRRYRNGRFPSERWQYLVHLQQRGYSAGRLKVISCRLLAIAQRVNIYDPRPIKMAALTAASKGWVKQAAQPNSQDRSVQTLRTNFVSIACNWLRFLGRLDEVRPPQPFADQLQEFLRHLRDDRGLADATVRHRRRSLAQFFLWLSARADSIKTVSPKDVSEYFSTARTRLWKRATILSYVHALRSFFRYAGSHSWCAAGIDGTIDGPRVYSFENLPQGPTWKDVQRLIMSVSGHHPVQIRNRAVILLLAVYGFRISEVCKLTLEDIDWEAERIHLRRPKQRNTQDYPLTAEVGAAILRYLKEVRPRSSCRELFLTLRTPYRPNVGSGLGSGIGLHLKRLGLQLPHQGPHALRHACATHLLSQGFSLKEIGDHLGHRSAAATRIYAKVDLHSLRQVADQTISELIDYSLQARTAQPLIHVTRLATLREVASLHLGGVL